MKCRKCGERLFDTLDGETGCVVCDAKNIDSNSVSIRKMKVFLMNTDKDLADYFKIAQKLSSENKKKN